ncbi:hypothetical protein GYA27_01815 [candidate division WWE3 bacterium]|uniref:Uncharacterized protein n=1 Tax=candidate division WWE3 bacterium TaxID=2053526 RepID=A0A7X9DK51_UNCKA|nr:hypothetical protein [candidate division WWE3 bacterium]
MQKVDFNSNQYQGTNCKVTKDNGYVYKTLNFGFTNFEDIDHFTYCYVRYANLISKYVHIPTISILIQHELEQQNYYFHSKETYCGKNLIEILLDRDYEQALYLLENTKRILYRIPNGIYIDAHPRNFTCLEQVIYYVDLIPPITTLESDREYLLKNFQIYRHENRNQLERRTWRYSSKDGRISKYNYYLNNFLNEGITPPNRTH